jgi:hypothetical protein
LSNEQKVTFATYIVKPFQQAFQHARPFGSNFYQRKSYESSFEHAYTSMDPSFAAFSSICSLVSMLTMLSVLTQKKKCSLSDANFSRANAGSRAKLQRHHVSNNSNMLFSSSLSHLGTHHMQTQYHKDDRKMKLNFSVSEQKCQAIKGNL